MFELLVCLSWWFVHVTDMFVLLTCLIYVSAINGEITRDMNSCENNFETNADCSK